MQHHSRARAAHAQVAYARTYAKGLGRAETKRVQQAVLGGTCRPCGEPGCHEFSVNDGSRLNLMLLFWWCWGGTQSLVHAGQELHH